MANINSFPPLLGNNPYVLILGSMPGKVSLQASQYYAHPRNAFWFIMENLLSSKHNLRYHQRQQLLTNHHIAVWDVLKSCDRDGSLDSSIDKDSMVANDFIKLFTDHPTIRSVFFNGAAAEKIFLKSLKLESLLADRDLSFIRLPSTSPAHAAMNQQQKLQSWTVMLEHLEQAGRAHHQL